MIRIIVNDKRYKTVKEKEININLIQSSRGNRQFIVYNNLNINEDTFKMKISKFQKLTNFFINYFKLKIPSTMEFFLPLPVEHKKKTHTEAKLASFNPDIIDTQYISTVKENEIIESSPDIQILNQKISEHILNLLNTFKYNEIIDIINAIPAKNINSFFFSELGMENNAKFFNVLVSQTLNLFSRKYISPKEQDVVNFLNFIKQPLFNKILNNTLNQEYKLSKKDYYLSKDLSSFNDDIEYENTFYSEMTNKLFSIDFNTKEYIYKGLDVLNSFEKSLIEISFQNIKYNLSDEKSGKYIYLLTDSFALLAFFHEYPEFQTSNVFHDKKKTIFKYFSNYNSGLKIITKKHFNRKHSREILNDSFSEANPFSVGNKLYQRALDKITKVPYIMAEHNNLLKQLNNTYGNEFLNTIHSSSIPEELSEKIKNKYFELEEWKNFFSIESDIETISFIKNTQKALLNIISIYEQVQDISPETNTATNLVEDFLSTVDKQILSYSEQSLNSIISSNKLNKKII